MDLRVAVYFSIGVCFAQLSHTIYSSLQFHNKRVRVLGWFPWFEREIEPDDLKSRLLSWMPSSSANASWPSELPAFQQSVSEIPSYLQNIPQKLGLHSTNIYYCIVLSVVYGVLSFSLLWSYPTVQFDRWTTVIPLCLIFLFFLAFSFIVVGSSLALFVIEGGLTYNSFVLLAMYNGIVDEQTILSLLQFGGIIIVSSLIFWLNLQRSEDRLGYGNFGPAFFIILNLLYVEFAVVLLWLVRVS